MGFFNALNGKVLDAFDGCAQSFGALVMNVMAIVLLAVFIQQAYQSYVNWKTEFYPLLFNDTRQSCKDKSKDKWNQQQNRIKQVLEGDKRAESTSNQTRPFINDYDVDSLISVSETDLQPGENDFYPAGTKPKHFLLSDSLSKNLKLFNKKMSTKKNMSNAKDNNSSNHQPKFNESYSSDMSKLSSNSQTADEDGLEEDDNFQEQKQLLLITSGITLRQYILFFFTLRMEHIFDKAIQFIQYYWLKLKGDLDFTPSDEDSQIEFARMVWTTSLMTGYEGKELNENGEESLVFRYRDYDAVHGDNKFYRFDVIEVYIPVASMEFSTDEKNHGDLIKARCSIFVDGEKEIVENMYAVFYFGLISAWIHPRIHALAAWISKYKLRGGIFERMHLYTNAINYTATFPAVVLDTTTCPVLRSSLENAVSNNMWKHNILANDLSKVNRLVHFIHNGRKIVKQSLKDMNIDINPEVFMAGSLLHSLDHNLLYKNTSFTRLLKSDKYNIDARLFAFLFINCTRGYIVDTRMSNQPEPFIQEIYLQLSHLDKEYADLLHYCISW